MAGKNIVTINGRSYDAITGMPVASSSHAAKPKPAQQHKNHHAFNDITAPKHAQQQHPHVRAHTVHTQLQKSQTLHRAALKKPAPLRQLQPAPVKAEVDFAATTQTKTSAHTPEHHEQMQSPVISRFGPSFKKTHAAPVRKDPALQATTSLEKPVRTHPVVAQALAKQPAPIPRPQSSKE